MGRFSEDVSSASQLSEMALVDNDIGTNLGNILEYRKPPSFSIGNVEFHLKNVSASQ